MPDKTLSQILEELNNSTNKENTEITDKTYDKKKTKEQNEANARQNELDSVLRDLQYGKEDRYSGAIEGHSTNLTSEELDSMPKISSGMSDQEMKDYRAESQTGADMLGNTLVNLATTAVTGASEMVLDLITPVPMVAAEALMGKDTTQSFIDNTLNRGLDNFEEYVKKEFPIYYTQGQEQINEDKNFLQKMLPGSGVAPQFWAETIGGQGFTIGAMLMGVGIAKLGQSLLMGAEEALLASAAAGEISAAEATAVIARNKFINRIATGYVVGAGEATKEARTTKNEIISMLAEDRTKGLNQYSDTEIADIAQSKGNINFVINAFINGAINTSLMKNYIGGQFAEKVGINSIKRNAEGELIDASLGRFAGTKSALAAYGEGFWKEGNEEMLQAVSNKALNDYVRASEDPKFNGTLADMVNTTVAAAADKYGSMSGLEEGFIGGLTGGLFGLKGARNSRKQREANTAQALMFMKADPGFALGILNNISDNAQMLRLNEEANIALGTGNRYEYENKKHAGFTSYVTKAIDSNTVPFLKETINQMANATDEEFRKTFDYKENYQFKPGEKQQIVDKAIEKIEKIEKKKELIDEALPYIPNRKLSKEKQVEAEQFNRILKKSLLFTDSMISNIDSRISKLITDDINYVSPELSFAITNNDLAEISKIKSTLSPLQQAQVTPFEEDIVKLKKYKEDLLAGQKELLTERVQNAIQRDIENTQAAIVDAINSNAESTEEELADDAKDAEIQADSLKVQINTLADKIAEGHGQSDLQLTDVEKELKANHLELLNARLAELENNKTDKKEGVKTGTYPSNNLINKGIKLGFSKENIVDMSVEEREMVKSATSKDDVKNLLDKYASTTPTTDAKADIEAKRKTLGLQTVKGLFEPTQGAAYFRIILKGDLFAVLAFYEGGQWSIFPKQPNGEFQASDPKTGNALILSPEKRKEVVEKYAPKELIDLLEAADKVKGVTEQDKFMEGNIKNYLNLYRKENLEYQLDQAKQNLEVYKSPNYPNKDSQERIVKAQEEDIARLEKELAALEDTGQDLETLLNNTSTEVIEVVDNDNPIPDDVLNGETKTIDLFENYISTILKTEGKHFEDKADTKLNPDKSQQRWFKYLQNTIPGGYKLMFVTEKNNPKLWNKLVTDAEYAAGTKGAKDGIYAVIVNEKNIPIISDINGNEIKEGVEEIKNSIPDFDGAVKNASTPTSGWVYTSIALPTAANRINKERIARELNITSDTPITKDSPEVKEYIDNEVTKLVNARKAILNAKIGDKYVVSYSEIESQSPGIIIRTFDNPGTVAERINSLDNIELEVAKLAEGSDTAKLSKAGNRTVDNGKLYAIDKTNSRVERLNSRFLNQDEIELAYQLIYNIANSVKSGTEKLPKNILEDLIYIGNKLKNNGLNISIDYKTRKVTVGSNEFTGKELEANKDIIKKVLAGRLVQVSGKYRMDAPFTEYKVDNGVISVAKEWSSYKEYLLDGTNRKAPFTTTVASKKDGGLKSKNPYLIFSDKITLHSIKTEATEATNVESAISELVIHEEPEEDVQDLDEFLEQISEEQDFVDTNTITPIETDKGSKIDIFKPKEGGGKINIPLDRKAIKEVTDYKKQNLEKELGWFIKAFPNIPVKLVKTLVDGHAFGQFVDGGVKLFKGAETGTIYHEAFHVTTQIYLDKKQIAKIYKEARERLNLPNATDLEIEETLAEDFREYVLSGGSKVFNKTPYKSSYFRRLLNLIKSLFRLKTTGEIEKVYSSIYSGNYAKANTVNNNQFKSLLNKEGKTKTNKLIEQAEPLNGDYDFDKNVLDGVQFYFQELLEDNGLSVNDVAKYADVKSLLLNGTKADGTKVKGINNVETIINNKAVELQEEYNKDTTKEYLKDLLANYKYILDNFDRVTKRFDTRISAISKYATEKSKGEDFNIDNIVDIVSVDSDEEISEKEDKKAGEMYSEANKTSTKETMFATTKYLISSLPKLNKFNKNELNNLGFPTLVNFNETYGVLLHQLSGLNNIEDMYAKIKELAVRNPTFNVLLERLKDYNGVLTEEQFLTQKQFQQDFAKTKNESYITIISDGAIFTTSANKNALTDKIKTQWDANTKTVGKYIKQVPSGYTVDMKAVNENNLNGAQFLNAIGIKLNKAVISKFANTEEFNKAVEFIRGNATLQYAKNLPLDLFSKDSKVKGRVDYLLGLEADFSDEVVELSFVSAEGKTIYQISLNNMLTKVANTMNQATSLDELYKALPHLNTSGTRNSIWLKTMFNKEGKRRKIDGVNIDLEIALLDGLKNNNTEEGTKTTSLSGYDKIILDLNNLLKTGLNPYIRAGDKATEHAMRMSQYVTTGTSKQVLPVTIEDLTDGFNNKSLLTIFKGYLKDELRVIREFRLKKTGANIDKYGTKDKNNKIAANEFRLFDGILSKETKDKLLASDLVNKEGITVDESKLLLASFQKDINAEIITFFENYFEETQELFDEYGILNSTVVGETEEDSVKEGLDSGLNKYSKDNLIRTFIVNNLINNIEQTKLFIGDLGFYSDLFKRTSAYTGTKEFCANDASTISQLNKLYKENPRSDGKPASENLDVVVYDDITFKSNYLSNYIKALVDGGIKEDKATKILKAYNSMDIADAQGLITLDAYREMRLRTGLWTVAQSKAYKKAIKGEILSATEMAYFNVEKSQYAGPQSFKEGDPNNNLFIPAFHKFSLLPLFPQLVKGTNMQKVYNKMIANKIDYALFRSGSKVGTIVDENNNANQFYTNGSNGEVTTKDNMVQKISWSYLGTQVRIDPKIKDKMTFGTQYRKLILSNLFDAGIANEKNTNLVKEYNQIVKALTYKGKQKLMKKFGFTSNDVGDITSKNLTKLVNALKTASLDRSLPDNLTNALMLAEKDARYMLKYPVDSLVNKDKIENMLMALINADIIKQKVNGDSLIQASIAGFEKIGEKKELDDTLPFYKMLDKDGKPTTKKADAVRVSKAGCRIPANGQYAELLERLNLTIEEANIELAKLHAGKPSKIREEWVSLIGYRIPTQGLNSIENLIVMEFLPANSGSLIMLPSEIVAKSGGDFDVDKLNIIKPLLNLKAENENDIFKSDTSNKRRNDYTFVEKDNLINRLLEISSEILKDPDNFIGLITPNSTNRLSENVEGTKEDSKHSMRALRGEPLKPTLKDKTQQLKYRHVLDQFIYFLTGKAGVGIGAVHNTHHILSQLTGLKLSKEFTNEFFIKPKSIDANGNISIGEITNLSGDKISDILSEFINAYVDIAKDPFIFDLNGGTDSAGVYFLLIRTGADFDTIVRFMNQPIIAQFAKLKRLNKSVTKDKVKDKTLIKELGDSYREAFLQIGGTDEDLTKSKYNTFSTEDNITLENFISRGYKKGEYQSPSELIKLLDDKTISDKNKDEQRILLKRYLRSQIQFINNYSTYNKMSKMLSETMQASNHDTAGLGKNLQSVKDKKKAIIELKNKNKEAISKQARINKWIEENPDKKPSDAPERMSLEDYPIIPNWENAVNNTFIKAMNQNKLAINMYKDMFITHSDTDIDTMLTGLLDSMRKGKDEVRSKLDTLLRNDFIQYLVQNYYEVNDTVLTKIRNDLFKGDNSLAKRMLAIRNNPTEQNKALLDNLFFKELLPVLEQAQIGAIGNTDNLKMFTKRFDTLSSNIFTQEFRKIKDISPALYDDIIRLGIMQSGLNNSPITFVGLIPYEEHGNIVTNAVENFYKKNGVGQLDKFKQLFYRNNWKGILTKNGDISYGKFGDKVFKLTEGNALPILGNGMFSKNYDLDNWVKETKVNKSEQISLQEEFTNTDLESLTTQLSTSVEVKKLTKEEADWLYNNLKEITKKYNSTTLANSKDIELKTPLIIGQTKVTHIDPEAGGRPSIIFERPSGRWMVKLEEKNSKMFPRLYKWTENANQKEEFSFYVSEDSNANDIINLEKAGLNPLMEELYKDTNIQDPGTRLGQFETSNALQQKYGIKRTYKDIVNELKPSTQATVSTGFQGYKGGFEDKGTPEGDGKDKAMRQVADGFIGEIVKNNSPTQTSRNFMIDKTNKADKSQNSPTSAVNVPLQTTSGGKIIMLARNLEFKGKSLTEETKYWIKNANIEGAEFVVGDMPGVDSQFIDYLQEIGAKFTIYHTGTTPRIQVKQLTTQPSTQSITVKPGVQELFNSNPEIASVGTPQQYSQYLDSIFPNSKVKDVVYHGTLNKLETFDKNRIGKNIIKDRPKGFYFTNNKGIASRLYGSREEVSQETGEIELVSANLINVIINTQPRYEIIDERDDVTGYGDFVEYKSYVVFEPEQIHILGSKQDIEGFKKFVNKSTNNIKKGVEISSNAKGLAAALTNPTELAKSKGNLEQSYPVNFRGKTYKDAEAAYQALKSTATKDEGSNSTYNLMVDIIKAKLEQYPRLVSEITKQGGSAWILSSTHQPTSKNTVWETGGSNWFIKTLNDAYIKTSQPTKKTILGMEVLEPDEEDMRSNLTSDEIKSLKENNNDTFEDNSDIVCPIKK